MARTARRNFNPRARLSHRTEPNDDSRKAASGRFLPLSVCERERCAGWRDCGHSWTTASGQERSFENPVDFERDSIEFLDRDSMKALCDRGPEMANGGYPLIRQVVQEVVASETIV